MTTPEASLKKWCVFLQLRLHSSRFPLKVLAPLGGMPIVQFLAKRLQSFFGKDKVYALIAQESDNQILKLLLDQVECPYLEGDCENVLKRFADANQKLGYDYIVRVTGDDPLTDLDSLEKLIHQTIETQSDYGQLLDLPIGAQEEVLSAQALESCYKNAFKKNHFEHVVDYILENQQNFSIQSLAAQQAVKRPDLRITLDTIHDYQVIKSLVDALDLPPQELTLEKIIAQADQLGL